MNPPAAPRSLCILRLSALGDATHMVPLVRTLQRAWPALPITWIIGKGEAKLLEGLEGVEFLVFDKKSGWAGCTGRDAGAFSARRSVGRLSERSVLI